jgi:exodeoxyribonuclease-3
MRRAGRAAPGGPVTTWQLSTLNLNGLRSAVRKGFPGWLASSGADAIALQELRIQRDQLDADHLPPAGWTWAQADAEKKGYSGTAVWTRLPVLGAPATTCGVPLADGEGRFTRVDTPEASIISLYAPSGSSGEARQALKDAFLGDLMALTGRLLSEGRPMVICGDINIAHTPDDIHNARANEKSSGFLPHERAWMGQWLDQGWVDLYRRCNPGVRGYSWWSQRGQARALDRGWRIDYLLATPDLADRVEACWMEGREPALSDHGAVHARFRRA